MLVLKQGDQQTFSVKDQKINILGFGGHIGAVSKQPLTKYNVMSMAAFQQNFIF